MKKFVYPAAFVLLTAWALPSHMASAQKTFPLAEGPITENFLAQKPLDLIVAVNSLGAFLPGQNEELQSFLQKLLQEGTASKALNNHWAWLSANPVVAGQDWVRKDLGLFEILPDGQRYWEMSSNPEMLLPSVDSILSSAKLGGGTDKVRYQRVMARLMPIVVKISQGGAQGLTQDEIIAAITPLMDEYVRQETGGYSSQEIWDAVWPLIDHAAHGGWQKQDYDELLSTTLPMAATIALNGYSHGQYSQVAKVMMPAIVRLAKNPGQATTLKGFMDLLSPLAKSDVSGGPFSQFEYLQRMNDMTPLAKRMLLWSFTGHVPTTDETEETLLPLAIMALQQSGHEQEAAMLQVVMPQVFTLLQDPTLKDHPTELAVALSDPAFFSVIAALRPDHLKGAHSGFLRDGSDLAILFIGDQSLGTLGGDPSEIAQAFLKVLERSKFGQDKQLRFAAILGKSVDKCDLLGTVDRHVYSEVALQRGGEVGDLCRQPAERLASDLIEKWIRPLSRYRLSMPALSEAQSAVSVDGVDVLPDLQQGWSLGADAQSIEFHGASVPSAGQNIAVRYVPRGDQ